jgi:hypothetical protein
MTETPETQRPTPRTITIPRSAKGQPPQPTPHSIKHAEICERRQEIIDRGGA